MTYKNTLKWTLEFGFKDVLSIIMLYEYFNIYIGRPHFADLESTFSRKYAYYTNTFSYDVHFEEAKKISYVFQFIIVRIKKNIWRNW